MPSTTKFEKAKQLGAENMAKLAKIQEKLKIVITCVQLINVLTSEENFGVTYPQEVLNFINFVGQYLNFDLWRILGVGCLAKAGFLEKAAIKVGIIWFIMYAMRITAICIKNRGMKQKVLSMHWLFVFLIFTDSTK